MSLDKTKMIYVWNT